MIERFDGSEGLGRDLSADDLQHHRPQVPGLSPTTAPKWQYCHEHLEGLIDRRRRHAAAAALQVAGVGHRDHAAGPGRQRRRSRHEPSQRAVGWLLAQEVRRRGDWSKRSTPSRAAGASNTPTTFYPDVDDTVMVLMALANQFDAADGRRPIADLHLVDQRRAASAQQARDRVAAIDRVAGAMQRRCDWVLAMQNRDGGWGAFDRDNDREFLCHVPFADHNAMIDPSTPDLAGRMLEMLGHLGRRVGDPAVDRAVAYMRRDQEADGSWFGRWGVNYIYGTWQSLVGLAAVGVPAGRSG